MFFKSLFYNNCHFRKLNFIENTKAKITNDIQIIITYCKARAVMNNKTWKISTIEILNYSNDI